MKTCTKCKIAKPLEEFHRDSRRQDGRSTQCGRCRTDRQSTYQKTEAGKAVIKAYRKTGKFLSWQRDWQNNKTQKDLNFKLRRGLRNRLGLAIKNKQKVGSAIDDLGCGVESLRLHLESKFQPGMTWENWGNGLNQWNIDHIRPLSSFDLTQRDQFLSACHYTNLQPLWAFENLRKSDKVPEENQS